jgi:hypothetical protein
MQPARRRVIRQPCGPAWSYVMGTPNLNTVRPLPRLCPTKVYTQVQIRLLRIQTKKHLPARGGVLMCRKNEIVRRVRKTRE